MSRYDQNSNTYLHPKLWYWNTGFFMVKPAQLQRSRISCGKARCHVPVLVPTPTWNRSSRLELFLTLCTYSSKCRDSWAPSACLRTSPSADIRGSPVSMYECQPYQPIWLPAQSSDIRSIYATLPPLATLRGARNKQTNKQRWCTTCDSHSSLLKTLFEK